MTQELRLSDIRTDGGTQMRANLQTDVFLEYRDVWLNGAEFPPVDVFHDGAAYWLADGFHRFYGAREAKRETIPANVRRGTVRDAILFACGANKANGLRRSNADKRRSVETMLNDEEWCKWSDQKIAEQAGVSQPTVSSIRAELIKVISSPAAQSANEPRIGRDGKKRKPPQKSGAVSRAFDNLAQSNGKASHTKPQKPSKGREVTPAKVIDKIVTAHVSPLVRAIDEVAEINGGKGDCHRAASQCLDDLIDVLDKMREGQK